MEIWVLGATGRIGQAVAARLAGQGLSAVAVGRESDRLRKTSADLGLRTVVADGVEAIATEIARQRPAVVVNAIGDYVRSASTLARACMPGGHYLDLAADPTAVPRLLGLHEEAAEQGSTLVTGAGFGVLGTEAVVVRLCEGRPTPLSVWVDALASVAVEAGVVGSALAASIVDAVAVGGNLGAHPQELTLPDGQQAKSAGAPTAELIAAQRASGTSNVTVTTGLAPTSPLVRALLPLAARLLSIEALRRFAVRRLADVKIKSAPRPRQHSWGHAVVTWPDGSRREGWLRADDGMDFTVAVATEVAVRLARGEGKPGAHTPAAALGPDLATAAGGTFILD